MASNAIDTTAPAPVRPAEMAIRVRRPVSVALWPMIVLIYAAILPREINFSLGGLIFYTDRIGYVLVLPYLVKKLMEGAIRFVLPDILVLLGSIWMIVAMTMNYGLSLGLERGGSLAFDATIGYYMARISFRSLQDMRRALILVAPGLLIAGISVMLESVLHRMFVGQTFARIFGALELGLGAEKGASLYERNEIRMGLMRGRGPFSHSIHAGVFLVSWLPLYLMCGIRGWPKLLGVLASLLSFFSLSSIALQGIVLSSALVAFDRIQRRVRDLNWTTMLMVGGGLAMLLNVVSSSGVIGLVGRFLTFNPMTAYFRQLIWQYATVSVWNHPWFGIGFESYERPVWMVSESIDAHWLLLAVRFGLPAAIAIFLATVLALLSLSQSSVRAMPGDQRFYRGIAISLFTLSLAMFTVTLWGNLQALFNILLGACVACSQQSYVKIRIQA